MNTGSGKKRFTVAAAVLIAVAVVITIVVFTGERNGAPIERAGIVEGVEVNLSSRVFGRIVDMCCKEGDQIRKGQVAFRLDSDDLKAEVDQASAVIARRKAEVASAKSSLGNARALLKIAEAEIEDAVAELDRVKVSTEQTKRDWERAEELYKQDSVSREFYEKADTVYKQSVADIKAAGAKVTLSRSKRDAAEAQLDYAQSQLASARATLEEAQANLAFHRSRIDDTIITSPIDGTVVYSTLRTGETVNPGEAVMTVVDLAHLYVRVDLEETEIGGVVLHGEAVITHEGLPDRSFKGRIIQIGRYGEFAVQRDVVRGQQDIKTFQVRIEYDDPEGFLKPGMTVDVKISDASEKPLNLR